MTCLDRQIDPRSDNGRKKHQRPSALANNPMRQPQEDCVLLYGRSHVSLRHGGCEIFLHVAQQLTRLSRVVPCGYPESPDKGRMTNLLKGFMRSASATEANAWTILKLIAEHK